MQILIENSESLEIFANEGQWIKDISQGHRFKTTAQAFRTAKQESVGKFNIVGYFPDTRQFINLDHGRGKGAAEIAA